MFGLNNNDKDYRHARESLLENRENQALSILIERQFISHELSPICHYANDCI